MHKVFVYGTLRDIASGGKQPDATHLLSGYQMYDYGAFPYIVKDGGAAVVGNVIEVDDAQLEDLDRYENIANGLYTRETVEVWARSLLSEPPPEKCFVYVATSNLHPQKVASGDWFKR